MDAVRASGVADRLIISTEDEGMAIQVRCLCPDARFMCPAELTWDPAPVLQAACSYIAQPQHACILPWERSVDIYTELYRQLAEAMPKAGR